MSRLEVTEKIITAKVTRGLKWSDGSAFTAGDVVFL